MKIWILFLGIWLAITIFQALLGHKWTGYSALFQKSALSGFEAFMAVFCMAFYGIWTVAEIVKCYKLLQEYKEFVKSIEKNLEIKQTLYQIKITLVIIIVGSSFFLLAGMMNTLNWIWFLIMLIVKFYYASRYKKLINLIGYKEEKNVFKESGK